jgi:hypothetical protein
VTVTPDTLLLLDRVTLAVVQVLVRDGGPRSYSYLHGKIVNQGYRVNNEALLKGLARGVDRHLLAVRTGTKFAGPSYALGEAFEAIHQTKGAR